MTYYTEGETLDLSDLVAIPHFIGETDGISKLDYVELRKKNYPAAVFLTRSQSERLWGETPLAEQRRAKRNAQSQPEEPGVAVAVIMAAVAGVVVCVGILWGMI